MAVVAPENRPSPLEPLLAGHTPAGVHYRRNHFPYPEVDAERWELAVTGAVERPMILDLSRLQDLPSRSLTVLLECAGHRRTEYDPPIEGVQWELGALGQATWTGVPLAKVLGEARPAATAMEVALYGADRGPFKGVPGEHCFARSLPLEKAADPDTLLAWEMDEKPIPHEHGGPLRAIVPGWYAMDSVKWLTRIEVRTEPFRGPFQELDYRFIRADDEGIGERLTRIPVDALLVSPNAEESVPAGPLTLRGIAWGGEGGIARVDVSVDGGEWSPARLSPPPGPYQRATWELSFDAVPGEHAVAVRATDAAGNTQPEAPEWNRRGYRNHSIHRVRLRVR